MSRFTHTISASLHIYSLYLLIITCTYFGSSSIIHIFLQVFSHAIRLLQLPQNKSNTLSHRAVKFSNTLWFISTGFWLGWRYVIVSSFCIFHTAVHFDKFKSISFIWSFVAFFKKSSFSSWFHIQVEDHRYHCSSFYRFDTINTS